MPIILLLLADILLSGFLLLWDNNDDSSNYENFALICLIFGIWAAWQAAQTLYHIIELAELRLHFVLDRQEGVHCCSKVNLRLD